MRKIKFIILAPVIIFVLPVLAGAFNLYLIKSDNQALEKLQRLLPYPIAYVEGKIITYQAYKQYYDDIAFQNSRVQELGIEGVPIASAEDLKEKALDALIRKTLATHLAQKEGVTVSEEEQNTYFQEQILPQAGNNEAQLEQTVKDLFGWSVEDFKKNVIQEYLIQKKLGEKRGENIQVVLDEAEKAARIIKFTP